MSGARGRRPGSPDTRNAILEAAREMFAAAGYSGASVRAIAARAGVDAALVHHYFGSKDALFAAAAAMPIDTREILVPVAAAGPDGAGERLLRVFFGIWDDPELRLPMLGFARTLLDPGSQALARDAVERIILEPVGVALGISEPRLRMSMVGTQMVGLVMLRYLVAVEPLASTPAESLIEVYAPTIQRYLTEPLPEGLTAD